MMALSLKKYSTVLIFVFFLWHLFLFQHKKLFMCYNQPTQKRPFLSLCAIGPSLTVGGSRPKFYKACMFLDSGAFATSLGKPYK